VPLTQNLETNKLSKSSEILETHNLIKTNRIEESTEFIKSTQVEKLDNSSDYSPISQNNLTTEVSETKESIQILLSNEITESLDIINSEKFTDKLTYEKNSIKLFSNEITELDELSESTIKAETTKTELINIKVTNEINEMTDDLKTERVDDTSICEEKCSKCNEISNSKNLCIECNEEKKYFQIIINSNIDFKECIKEEAKPKNYYFNETERTFKPCYYTCETCLTNGDSNDHNCITCAKNYIFYINKNNNCIIGCKYYFYFTNYKEYKCTIQNVPIIVRMKTIILINIMVNA
jgi:hypothetical protein